MKIEAGCKAVIVNSKAGNNGIIVTVLGVAGEPGFNNFWESEGVQWTIDREITSTGGIKHNHVGEACLKRIDDDSRKVVSWDDCAWTPHKKSVDA